MNIMRRCPVCSDVWDKSDMMCPSHPGVLGVLIVKYEDEDKWQYF